MEENIATIQIEMSFFVWLLGEKKREMDILPAYDMENKKIYAAIICIWAASMHRYRIL